MIVRNYDRKGKQFQPEKVVLDVKFIYPLIKKYISQFG